MAELQIRDNVNNSYKLNRYSKLELGLMIDQWSKAPHRIYMAVERYLPCLVNSAITEAH